MRLRLTVQRHGLPPVQLLWTAGHVLPAPYAAAGSSITISQFVEQVNDIIPLECDDWGLEDYAVEVCGFECLHFSEVGQVLKEDDEVCIRPLQTSDLRVRRITGRHQISADGKHLIDGVAFGRPYLRKADRPAIRIPPRKRRRITYDEEDDVNDGGLVDERQIVVRAGFNDVDEATAGEGVDADDNVAVDDEDDNDLNAELKGLREDLDADSDEHGLTVGSPENGSTRITRPRKSPRGLGLLQLTDDSGRLFAGQYRNPLLDIYEQDEPCCRRSALKLGTRSPATSIQHARKRTHTGTQQITASPEHANRRSSNGSNKGVRFQDEERPTPATDRESEDSDEADDEDFEPAEVDESDKENAEPKSDDVDSSTDSLDASDSSSSTFSEPQGSSSEQTSSSGSSSSDSSSDSEPEIQSSKMLDHGPDPDKTSSSASSTSTDSDSAAEQEVPEIKTRRTDERKAAQKHLWAMGNVKTALVKATAEPIASSLPSGPVAPNEGAKRTKKRNERRRKSKKMAWRKDKGTHLDKADTAEYQTRRASNSVGETSIAEVVEQARKEDVELTGDRVEFEAKRQALLASIALGGADISPGRGHEAIEPGLPQSDGQARVNDNDEAPPAIATENDDQMADVMTNTREDQEKVTGVAADEVITGAPMSPLHEGSTTSPTITSQNRRSKLDISGTKRMLFGSLGLRMPKNEEDESKIREKLMKDVKPMKKLESNTDIGTADDIAAAATDNSWRDKIDLRAVECSYEGVELSTPPFPFIQRWDPQQQREYNYGTNKKRKNKKRKRNNHIGYEESSYESQHSKAAKRSEYDTPGCESQQQCLMENEYADVGQPEKSYSQDESLQDSVRVNEQLQRETEDVSERTLVQAEDGQDLPPLPENPTICPQLTREMATAGTIIAFKQFVMSAQTHWQPSISEYRTAVVKEVMNEGELQLELARRDQPTRDFQYDEKTGERIYRKFEMPGFNDVEDESYNGQLQSAFEDLIEPILVKASDIGTDQDREQQGQEQRSEENSDSTPPRGLEDKASVQNSPDAIEQPFGGLDGAAGGDLNVEAIMPGEESRQEISELIKEAGWRSSIGSGVNGIMDAHGKNDAVETDGDDECVTPTDAPSPKFHGFSSISAGDAIEVASSPLPAEIKTTKPEHIPGFEIADSFPPPDPVRSDASPMALDTKLPVEYPALPSVGNESYGPQLGDDSDLFQEGAQHISDPLGLEDQPPSQDLLSLSGMEHSPAQSTRSRTLPSPQKSSPNISKTRHHPSDSEEEFPPLFSQAFEARMSQDVTIKSEFSSQEASISPPAKRKNSSRFNGGRASLENENRRDCVPEAERSGFDDSTVVDDDGGSTPRASQQPGGSNIVDLTMTSDPPHTIYSDDDDDSYVLPSGPGWVKKSRTSGAKNVPAKANSGKRKTKSR